MICMKLNNSENSVFNHNERIIGCRFNYPRQVNGKKIRVLQLIIYISFILKGN